MAARHRRLSTRFPHKTSEVGVEVTQKPGKIIFWILPGKHRLGEAAWGTPDYPKAVLAGVMAQAKLLPVPLNRTMPQLLRGISCTFEGVPCRTVLYEHSRRQVSCIVFPYAQRTITTAPHARIEHRTIYAHRFGISRGVLAGGPGDLRASGRTSTACPVAAGPVCHRAGRDHRVAGGGVCPS
jgi:hypothetical protein